MEPSSASPSHQTLNNISLPHPAVPKCSSPIPIPRARAPSPMEADTPPPHRSFRDMTPCPSDVTCDCCAVVAGGDIDSDDAAGRYDSDWTASPYSSEDDEYDEQELVNSYRRMSTLDTTDYETECENEESESAESSDVHDYGEQDQTGSENNINCGVVRRNDVTHRRKRLRSSGSDAPTPKKRVIRAEDVMASTSSSAVAAHHPPTFIRKCKELLDNNHSSHTVNATSQWNVSASVFRQDGALSMTCFNQDYDSDDVFYDDSDERCASSAIPKPANAALSNSLTTSNHVPLLAIASPVRTYPHYPPSIGFSEPPSPSAHAVSNTVNSHPTLIPHPSATSHSSTFGAHSHFPPSCDSGAGNNFPLPHPSSGFAPTSTVNVHPPLITYPSTSSHSPPPITPISQETEFALKIASTILSKEAFPPGLLASDDSQSLPSSPPPLSHLGSERAPSI